MLPSHSVRSPENRTRAQLIFAETHARLHCANRVRNRHHACVRCLSIELVRVDTQPDRLPCHILATSARAEPSSPRHDRVHGVPRSRTSDSAPRGRLLHRPLIARGQFAPSVSQAASPANSSRLVRAPVSDSAALAVSLFRSRAARPSPIRCPCVVDLLEPF